MSIERETAERPEQKPWPKVTMSIDYGLFYTGGDRGFLNENMSEIIGFDFDGCSDYLKANGLSDDQIRNTEILLAPPYYMEHMKCNGFTEQEALEFFESDGT
ncbi:MAG: hypothetical protein LBL08_02360 [Candidatus Nomurabacteria bacterium]|jgi:hypothetical protein|nr:hypothetical protein [Candidatus Nomurabacteria bacterium]